MSKLGTHILCYGKSQHSGQKGTVVKDYGNYLMVIADDQSYSGAHTNSGFDKKVFQVDSLLCKQLKD